MVTGEWLWVPTPRPEARIRLVCIPYAGGGASLFRQWPALLPNDVEVAAVRLPGRERRYAEPPIHDFDELLDALAAALDPLRHLPLALFGHSLGAILAYELARRIGPDHLFVSGCAAPDLFAPAPTTQLSDAEFLRHLRTLGALPGARTQRSDLLELMLPMVRADFAAAESYAYSRRPPLPCPIHGFRGTQDPHVTEAMMRAWHGHTSGGFELAGLPGDHFFLLSEQDRLLKSIDAGLRLYW